MNWTDVSTSKEEALVTVGRVLVSVFVGACLAAVVEDWFLGLLVFGVISIVTYTMSKRLF